MIWRSIAALQNSKGVQAVAIWFIITPIAAKFLRTKLAEEYFLGTALPFSLVVFYISATAFFVSTILYTLWCPKIIRSYRTWSEFENSEGSYESLVPWVTEVLDELPDERLRLLIARQVKMGNLELHDEADRTIPATGPAWERAIADYGAALRSAKITTKGLNDIFSAARREADAIRPIKRWIITAFLVIGLAAIGVVLFQNAYYVYESTEVPKL